MQKRIEARAVNSRPPPEIDKSFRECVRTSSGTLPGMNADNTNLLLLCTHGKYVAARRTSPHPYRHASRCGVRDSAGRYACLHS